jgi:thiol-disulfide isomerase/thioredoxin
MNVIYGFTFKTVITFDTTRGLPSEFEGEATQTNGFKGKSTGTGKLDGVKTVQDDWLKQFTAEAQRFFAAQAAYGKETERSGSVEDVKAALEKGVGALKAARAELKVEQFQTQLDDQIKRHEQMGKYLLEDAERRAAVLDKPAVEFETTDLAGKNHALKDYRGKVVVLDFWYRGCGWCIRAMPQMKQVAEHFKDRPVVVFGMNTDSKDEDAKFVVEKMGLNYATLKAEKLPDKFKVQAFPTLLIIDQEGVVRGLHVGYSPTLKEDVVREIEKLLKGR